MAARSEVPRQLVHIGVGAFALLLPVISWGQAVLLALTAVAFNLLVLPRLARQLFRHGDLDAPMRSGIVIYPLAVLGLVLAFPGRMDIAAIAWVILAAGDGAATLVGAHVRSAALPWNRQKSVAGLLSFVLLAAAAGVGIAFWSRAFAPAAPFWWVVAAPLVAALIAGLIETAPIRLDDNISVPASAALVLWMLAAIDGPTFAAGWPAVDARLGPAVALNAVVALAGWRTHAVTASGGVTGFLIGLVIYAGAGGLAWAVLLICFAAAVAATRAGFSRKAALGIAEGRGGRRGPGNAIANTGIAAWIAMLIPGLVAPEAAMIALVAALVTGSSDTVASEIGKAWARVTWLVVGLRRVPPGTSGAASLEGTLGGVAAAAALATGAAAIGAMPASLTAVAIVTASATIASFAESVMAATLEDRGVLNNDALNFLNTGIGAALAFVLWRVT